MTRKSGRSQLNAAYLPADFCLSFHLAKDYLLTAYELWGLNVILNDLGTFREGDFLNCDHSRMIKDRITLLIR